MKELVMQYRIQYKINQDLLPGGIKQHCAPPMRAHLPTANMAQELDRIPEDMEYPTDSPDQDNADFTSSTVDTLPAVPPYDDDIDTQESDSAQYDYPWPPSVNSAMGMQHPSSNTVTCPFEYRALQE
jgi:hypothetical protein